MLKRFFKQTWDVLEEIGKLRAQNYIKNQRWDY